MRASKEVEFAYSCTQVTCYFAETDGSIGTDSRLLVIGGLCKLLQ